MGEYAAIEKEAKLFTELCVHNDAIDPNLFDEFGVKRGLRDKDGNGVLAGITNISRIDAFEMRDGVKTPCDGKLWYRGYNVYDLIRGLRGKRYGFEEVAYLLLLGDLPNEQYMQRPFPSFGLFTANHVVGRITRKPRNSPRLFLIIP